MVDSVNTQQDVGDTNSSYLAMKFMVQQLVGRACHVFEAQVQSVTNAGGVVPVGFVDVLPLVNQIDGAGNSVPFGVVHNLPYFRLQGGGNAIILDPEVGDIGIVVVADRDISSVKANAAAIQSGPVPSPGINPGSRRQFNMADGIYFGGNLNAVPTQYVEFSTAGIRIHSPTQVKLDAPDIRLDAETVEIIASDMITINATNAVNSTTPTFTITGELVVTEHISGSGGLAISGGSGAVITGPVMATGEGTFNGSHTVSAHTHTQGSDSHGDTEQPTNPPTG